MTTNNFLNPELERIPAPLHERQRVIGGACELLDIAMPKAYNINLEPLLQSNQKISTDYLVARQEDQPAQQNEITPDQPPANLVASIAVESASNDEAVARNLVAKVLEEIGYGN